MPSSSQLAQKRWELQPPIQAELSQTLTHIHPVLQQVLYNRGLTTLPDIQAFLEGQYIQSTDPFDLKDMGIAVDRILNALDQGEQVVIYGDFDCDGVTSTVLLTDALRALGFDRRQIRPYIPDRVDEGYGLNKEALTKIKEEFDANLVITVDCGIRSVDEVEHANSIGLDLIITDHHSIGPTLPPALAIVNPKQEGCHYPETMLAGVGIAYKLGQALHQRRETGYDVTQLLDLVAIGTVADVAPLLGENRPLVKQGLEVLNRLNRPGLASLAEVAGLKRGQISAESIGFAIGPRINAAGRIGESVVHLPLADGREIERPGHAFLAAYLLTAKNRQDGSFWANRLNDLNKKRQDHTSELNALAESIISQGEDIEDASILLAADESFLPGVVGLVAGRLKEKYYRPSIVLEKGDEESHGSCRSIPEFHITDALDEVSDLLERYGGHAQAAGLTILNENIPAFSERMSSIAAQALNGVDLRPTISIDAELDISDVDWALLGVLSQLEPTGCANVTPVFLSQGVELVHHRVVGRDKTHLQVEVQADLNRSVQGIGFGLGPVAGTLGTFVDIVYSIGSNEWKGRKRLQLQLLDIRPAG